MKLPKGFQFIGPKPYKHQLETFFFCKNRDSAGILLEPGLGKTKCAIDVARWKIFKKEVEKVLIICPTSVLILWQREIKRFSEYKAIVLYGPKEYRLYLLEKHKKHRFFIINYEMLFPLYEYLAEYNFDMLIFDESARYIKNPKAHRTRAAILLSEKAKSKLILTGTPIANKPLDVWAQFKVLDGGNTFGGNFYSFRARNFKRITKKYRGRKFFDYKLKKEHINNITEGIQENCIRKRKEDCFDLPEKIYSTIEIEMTKELADIYYSIQENIIKDINTSIGTSQLNINNILTKLLRLQQITSGFIKGTKDVEEIELKYTPKLDALIEEIQMIIDAEESVIVWCRFLKSIDMIHKRLSKIGIKNITMQGSDKDKDNRWRKFQKSNIPVFISQIQSGGVGIELFKENSNAKNQHTIFYENVWSLDWRIQAEDRLNRIGQKSTCIYKDIVLLKTIDTRILNVVKEKKEIVNIIMQEGINNWLKGGK